MRHYTHCVSIPLDKESIDLANEPRPIPWSHSTDESNCYINFYRSWIEASFQVTTSANTTKGETNLKLVKPHSCAISRIDGNFVFVSQDGNVLGSDFTEALKNESYYRTALDNCFCNAEKQMLDDYCPQYLGQQNIPSSSSNSFDINYKVNTVASTTNTIKVRIPIRLLSGFAARESFLLVKNFQAKIYFNSWKYWISSAANAGLDSKTITAVKLVGLDAFYDQTVVDQGEDPFPESLLTIAQCKLESAVTPVVAKNGSVNGSETRIKFTDTINFKPKLMVLWFTHENDNTDAIKKISPTFFKISTGSETNTNCSLDPDSRGDTPDYRLWCESRNCLDMNNSPVLRYDIWKNVSRYYLFSFAENFSLVNNSNYINYELRFIHNADETVHIHRAYLLDYLHNSVVEEESF